MILASGYWFLRSKGVMIPLSAAAVTWSLLVVVSVLELVLHFRLPEAYFRVKDPDKECMAYRRLGILAFRNWIRRGPLHVLAPDIQITTKGISIEALDREMRRAETVHVLSLLITVPVLAVAAVVGRWPGAVWILGFSVPLHVYPIMLQRYNRIRLNKALSRRTQSEGTSD